MLPITRRILKGYGLFRVPLRALVFLFLAQTVFISSSFGSCIEGLKGLSLTATVGAYGVRPDRMREILLAVRKELDPRDPRLKFAVRMNTSHMDVKDVLPTLDKWYRAAADVNLPLTVVVDMPGPKMRVPKLASEIPMSVGDSFEAVPVRSDTETWQNVPGKIPIPAEFWDYLGQLKVGERLSFADGRIVLVKQGEGSASGIPFKVIELQSGVNRLSSRKGFNIPSVEFRDVVTRKDKELIRLTYWSGKVPIVAASFVQSEKDLKQIRDEMAKARAFVEQVLAVDTGKGPLSPASYRSVDPELARQAHDFLFPDRRAADLAGIVTDLHAYFSKHRPIEPLIEAKLERPMAVSNAGQIANHATILVSAQGDLGVEVGLARLPENTDRIIATAKQKGIPAKVATRLFMGLLSEKKITPEEKRRTEEMLRNGASSLQVSDETTPDFSAETGPIPNYLAILDYLKTLTPGSVPPAPTQWQAVTLMPGESPRELYLKIYQQARSSERPLGLKVDDPVLARMLDYIPNVVVQGPALPR